MKLTHENIFAGAEVIKKGRKLIVYKINQKTFYAGEIEFDRFFENYENSFKGVTFKKFVEVNKVESFNYDGFEITEEEAEKGKQKGKKLDKSDKKLLSFQAEKTLINTYENNFKKGRNYKFPIYDGQIDFHIVVAKDDGKILFNKDNEFILFNTITKKYKKLENIFVGKLTEKTIPWNEV